MHTNLSEVELYTDIDIGNDEQEAAVAEMLATIELEQIVARVLQQAGISRPCSLSLLITSDEAIRELNRRYRQQDKATDVLSFPLLATPLALAPADQLWQEAHPQQDIPEGEPIGQAARKPAVAFITPPGLPLNLGDIVVSWPTILHQAEAAVHSPLYELLYLFSHGVLHLVGYDDATEPGYRAMVSMQEATLLAIQPRA